MDKHHHHDHDHGPSHDVKHEHGHEKCGCDHGHEHGHEHEHEHERAGSAALITAGDKAFEQRFFFRLETLALAVWGIVLLYFFCSTRVVSYLTTAGAFREQTLIAGLGLLVLAIFNFVTSWKKDESGCLDCGHDHDHDHGDGDHHHEHEESWFNRTGMLGLLIAPVVGAALFSPDAFSDGYRRGLAASSLNSGQAAASDPQHMLSKQAEQASPGQEIGGFTLQTLEEIKPRNSQGDFPLEIVELVATSNDTIVRDILQGQPVETVGQMVPDNFSGKPNRLRLYTLQMTCCAADARPVSVSLDFSDMAQPGGTGGVPDHKEMAHYKIRGTVDYESIRGQTSVFIHVKEMTQTARPPDAGRLY